MIDPDEMTDDEFDATCVTEWLEAREYGPLLPPAADGEPFAWAHENPRIWDAVRLPSGMTQQEAYLMMVSAAKAQTNASGASI